MSRAGEEMVLELAALLEKGVVKTAAEKEDDKKEDKKKDDDDKKKKEEAKKEDDDKKKDDDDKKEDKKASVMVQVLQDLVKLASELDDIGAEEASELVDDALKVIVKNLEEKKE